MKEESKKDDRKLTTSKVRPINAREKHTIWVHPNDWYVIEAHVLLINDLRRRGLRT